MTTPPAPLTVDELPPRLNRSTVVDVRTPGEFGSGHIPGAFNIPLDRLDEALPALRAATADGEVVVVCASGARSRTASDRLAAAGVTAASLDGGTDGLGGRRSPAGPAGRARAVWPMERQVRLVAGSLVLLGLLLDLLVPGARILSLLIGGGLVFSALSNTCGMAAVLSKLPYNRRPSGGPGLEATLSRLTGRTAQARQRGLSSSGPVTRHRGGRAPVTPTSHAGSAPRRHAPLRQGGDVPGLPAAVGQFAVARAPAAVRGEQQVGVEQGVAGGERQRRRRCGGRPRASPRSW